ncbi:hypothetical protein [Zoogloea sp.]|uniref:hypothetical protein n=1 Tax=Zoogloea sp. TaxID=49181 RepID=UPI00321FF22C
MNAGLDECWCASLPPALAVPEAHAGQCYCPDCLKAKIAALPAALRRSGGQ